MQITLENKKKVVADFPRSALKRKNKVEERRALSSKVKKEQESTNLRAPKMMRVRVEPSAVPIVVHIVKLSAVVPHMTSPQER